MDSKSGLIGGVPTTYTCRYVAVPQPIVGAYWCIGAHPAVDSIVGGLSTVQLCACMLTSECLVCVCGMLSWLQRLLALRRHHDAQFRVSRLSVAVLLYILWYGEEICCSVEFRILLEVEYAPFMVRSCCTAHRARQSRVQRTPKEKRLEFCRVNLLQISSTYNRYPGSLCHGTSTVVILG